MQPTWALADTEPALLPTSYRPTSMSPDPRFRTLNYSSVWVSIQSQGQSRACIVGYEHGPVWGVIPVGHPAPLLGPYPTLGVSSQAILPARDQVKSTQDGSPTIRLNSSYAPELAASAVAAAGGGQCARACSTASSGPACCAVRSSKVMTPRTAAIR
jgi:hypothetical protein